MTRTVRAILLVVSFTFSASGLLGQVQTGTPPFGTFGGGPDTINLANLNVHLDVPITQRAGRGTNFSYDLGYDSSVWYPVTSNGTTVWTPNSSWGWTGVSQVLAGYVSYTTTSSTKDNGLCSIITFSNYQFHDIFGTTHPFFGTYLSELWGGVDGQNTNCFSSSPLSSTASDGSGLQLTSSGFRGNTIYFSDGHYEVPLLNSPNGTVSVQDRNGNEISVTSNNGTYTFTDTLGQTSLTVTGTAPNPTTFSYTAPSGGTPSYTMKYTSYSIQTNFGCSQVNEYGSNGTTTANLVSEIDLPDGSKYTFQYENTPGHSGYVTARLASVTLPTGGTISYTYMGTNNGIVCSDGSTAGLKRYTPDTGGSAFWNYARTAETSSAYVTTVTDPTTQANQTIYQFQGIYETQHDAYSGSAPVFSTFPIPESTLQTSNLLQEIQTCYNGNTASCTSTIVGVPISQRNVTTILSGASSWANAKTSEQIFKYDSTGNLSEEDDYDYGVGIVGPLLRKYAYTYAPLSHITAFRQTATVTDGSGNTVSRTTYVYADTVTTTTGTPQHTTPAGSRGNLITVNSYSGSGGLTQSYTYYDTGNVSVSTDTNGSQTTYSYGSGSCGNSFPTSIAEPLGLSRTMTYNCTGAVQTSVVDENGKTWSNAYTDPYFWRASSTTDPTNAQTTYTYTGQNTVESDLPVISAAAARDLVTTLDGLGRSSLSQVRQTPGGSTFDSVEKDYDVMGRPSRNTLPFAATLGQKSSSAPGSTAAYDPLSRVISVADSGNGTAASSFLQNDVLVTIGPAPSGENTKQRQLEYDALGRLTSVCEITPVSGSGACGQSNAENGFLTKYSYDAAGRLLGVTQNAQSSPTQTRTYTYDWLGRLTSEANPENGTTNYVYDTDSTCGTSSGDLVKKVDAVGNVTCMSYDQLHRNIAVTYPSGGYASFTPAKHFVFDSAPVNGVTMTNTKLRLAEAYTCTGSCTSKITDEGFSYTARGEVSDIYQSTPNSGMYYHLTLSYWANGLPNQLGNNIASLPAFTYGGIIGSTSGLDGESRVTQVTASTGQNPVTGVSYNNGSLPTQVNYGSGDIDIFGYDPNTFRTTQFQLKVGTQSQSLTGNLTWNPNGSLGQLAITDQFNSADTQICNYSHDDLARIATANCGTAASQTFSYDPFGNISKSGSPFTFQATYSAMTNRIAAIGTFTPSYDANGNVLSDSLHTYTWDADGNSITVDGVGLTFDALDRMVEQNRSGVHTQVVYGPSGGRLALMNGQSLVKAFIPLPGQSAAVYTPSGLDHYRHSDWLGSARLSSTPSRTVLSTVAYAPFGETYAQFGTPDPSFTSQNSDTASDDYDFLFREYSDQGRWASPDPAGPAAVDSANPQSWNRYAYVLNSPLLFVDALGLCGGGPGNVTTRINGQVQGSQDYSSPACTGLPNGGKPLPLLPPTDGGGGNSSGSLSLLKVSKDLNRCAAPLAQTKSLSALSGGKIPEFLGSNFFSDVFSLATHDGGVDQGAGLATEGAIQVGEHAAGDVAVGTLTNLPSTPISATPGVYNPISAGTTSSKLFGSTAVGKLTQNVLKWGSIGKIGWDGAMYLAAEVACTAEAW